MDNIEQRGEILTDLAEGVLTVRLHRPDKKNALSGFMYASLSDALRSADRNDAVRVLLLTGGEECFTSGNDLVDFIENPPTGPASPAFQFLLAISELQKPVVAAVAGCAVGIGTTMLLHCDLVYAGEKASFSMPFVQLGLCPEAGSTLLLPRLLGHQRAAEMLLLGEAFSSDRAREAGIVTGICPEEALLATARSAALRLAALPPQAIRITKGLLKRADAAAVRETIAEEARLFLERLRSPEAVAALQAFKERKKPPGSVAARS